MYIQPGRTVGRKKAERSSVKVKRLGGPVPLPTGPSADAEVSLLIPRIIPHPSPPFFSCSIHSPLSTRADGYD